MAKSMESLINKYHLEKTKKPKCAFMVAAESVLHLWC